MSNKNKYIMKETQIKSELIFDGKVLHVYKDDISSPNGAPATREYIKHVGAVCVVPLTEKGEVICVKQFRYPFSSVMLEIPAGKLDSADEDPLLAAKRELREETGAVSESITYLGEYYGSPALIGEKIHMYLAEDLKIGDTDPDEDEFLEIVRYPIDELVDMIMSGKVPDGKTQAAVLRVKMLLEKRNSKN